MTQLKMRVARKEREADGICSLELESIDGQALPPFRAGAHIDFHLPGGLIRQYSLFGSPFDQRRYRIAVLLDANSRGGSKAVHESVHAGDEVIISSPRNHFPLVPSEKSILIAGGIGITPMLCMAEELSVEGKAYDLHYCVRTANRAAFLGRLGAAPFVENTHVHFDDASGSQGPLDLDALLAHPRQGVHLYMCGPSGLIDSVVEGAKRHNWPDDHVHFEHFAPPPSSQKQGGHGFEVRIASTGQTFLILPEESVAQVLARNGIDIPVSCEQGVCGTCVTRVIEGEPDHRDLFLTEAEQAANDCFTACCSRARGPLLVLDL